MSFSSSSRACQQLHATTDYHCIPLWLFVVIMKAKRYSGYSFKKFASFLLPWQDAAPCCSTRMTHQEPRRLLLRFFTGRDPLVDIRNLFLAQMLNIMTKHWPSRSLMIFWRAFVVGFLILTQPTSSSLWRYISKAVDAESYTKNHYMITILL